ncbi:sporulation protein YdfR [Bacillus freudenreichii]|nr:sporulation protein YdfR [Bacillus freudenreichii]
MNLFWQPLVILIAGLFLLKLGGRKSIAQMTMPQLIVMLSLGTLLVQPIAQKGVGRTLVVVGVFIVTLLLLEYIQVKSNGAEKIFTGKSKIVIQNGKLDVAELRKLRMTVDQLEMRLRTSGISNMDDIKTATIEPNGELGYELKDDAKPLTKKEFKKLMDEYMLGVNKYQPESKAENASNVFAEIKGNHGNHPKYLQ